MKTSKEYINLLPRDVKKPGSPLSMGLLLVLLFTLAWLGVFSWQMVTMLEVKKRTSSVSAKRQARELELTTLRQALGITISNTSPEKAALINSLLSERVLWSEVFKQFSHIVPKGLWFDSLEGNADDRREIRIRGGAFNYLSVAEFMLAMEKSGYLENPQLSYAQKAVVQGQDVIGFEIICGLNKPQGRK